MIRVIDNGRCTHPIPLNGRKELPQCVHIQGCRGPRRFIILIEVFGRGRCARADLEVLLDTLVSFVIKIMRGGRINVGVGEAIAVIPCIGGGSCGSHVARVVVGVVHSVDGRGSMGIRIACACVCVCADIRLVQDVAIHIITVCLEPVGEGVGGGGASEAIQIVILITGGCGTVGTGEVVVDWKRTSSFHQLKMIRSV